MTGSSDTRSTLQVGSRSYDYWSFAKLPADKVARLPFSLKILLENLLRFEDGVNVTREDIEAVLNWDAKATPSYEIDFTPARDYWQATAGYWAKVRAHWNGFLSKAPGVHLKTKVDGMAMIIPLFTQAGEIQEGQVWEAAMSAPKLGQPDHALDNLVVILDQNQIQLDNFVKKVLDIEPVIAKWQAFGWPVIEIEATPEEWELFAPVDRSRGDSLLGLAWNPNAPEGWLD